MRTVYICDKCGQEFDDWESCFVHENSHTYAFAIKHKSERYRDGNHYPISIEVEMSDKSIVEYVFSRVVSEFFKYQEEEEAE